MKATSLKRAIESRGGTAEIIKTHIKSPATGKEWDRISLKGTLNGWDVEMIGDESGFFTMRRITNRGHYDPGSDYNSGGYDFCNKLKELDWDRYQAATV
jgi:hypothetical protein